MSESSSSSDSSSDSSSSSSASPINWYNAHDMDVNTGSVLSGVLSDTYSEDNNDLVLNEVTGKPGFSYDFNFENLPNEISPYTVTFVGWYEGNPAHVVKLQIYNFETTDWENVTAAVKDFPDADSEQTYIFNLPDPIADYIDAERLQLRVIHTNNGSAGHYFYIDHLYLTEKTSSSSSSESSSDSSSSSSSESSSSSSDSSSSSSESSSSSSSESSSSSSESSSSESSSSSSESSSSSSSESSSSSSSESSSSSSDSSSSSESSSSSSAADEGLDPTEKRANLKDSIKKHFTDAIETSEGVPVSYDKSMATPDLTDTSVNRWINVIFGPIVRSPLITVTLDVYCMTRKDPEGDLLAELTDIAYKNLTDSLATDGLKRIGFYDSSDWTPIGALIVQNVQESAEEEGPDGTKFVLLTCTLRTEVGIFVSASVPPAGAESIEPSEQRKNVKDSIKKYFVDNLETASNIELTFDKSLSTPGIFGGGVTRWLNVQLGPMNRGGLMDLTLFSYCVTRNDPEGFRLAQLTDTVMGYLSDAERTDGMRRIPFYRSSDWTLIGALLVQRTFESQELEGPDGSKYIVLTSRLRAESGKFVSAVSTPPAGSASLDPTARRSNIKDSIKKYFTDSIETAKGIAITFDKSLTTPDLQGISVNRWMNIGIGEVERGVISEIPVDIIVATRRDPEGALLETTTDEALEVLTDQTITDGMRRIPFYRSRAVGEWTRLGALVVSRIGESREMEAPDGTKFLILTCGLKVASKI